NWFWMNDTIGVYSYQLSAVSSQLSQQCCQHLLDLRNLSRQLLVVLGFQKFEIFRQQYVILQLAGRSHGDKAKTRELGIPVSSATFGQIRCDRRARASNLTREPIDLPAREFRCEPVDTKCELMGLLPDHQLMKTLHRCLG